MPPKPRIPPGKGTRSTAPPGKASTASRNTPVVTGGKQQRPQPGTVTGASKKATPTAGPAVGRKVPPGGNKRTTTVPVVAKGRGAPIGKGGKGATATPSKSGGPAAPKKPAWTKEDDIARKIQTAYRGYRCRKLLSELKKKQADYDTLMEKLQREAFIQIAKLEQERAEQQRKREEEERQKRREYAKRIKRMLEAAFDGDTQEIKNLLKEVAKLYEDSGDSVVARYQYKLVECTDPNSNTPLSEAAAGGDPDVIRLLVNLDANPNSKGQFGRTPLYRAAFAGHMDAVKVLLESGADPRINADDGARPDQVAAQESVEEYIQSWDIAETESLLGKLGESKAKRLEIEKKEKQAAENQIQCEIDEAEKDYSTKQKQLTKAYEELNKRIYEHDEYGPTKAAITLPAVHDAEDLLEKCKLHAEEARKKLQQIRLKLRMKRKEFHDLGDEEEEEDTADVVINIKELDDVLLKDVGNNIASSGKWPLIIDSGKQAATFLRYRDTNYMNACNPRHMECEVIRMSLLGAIRYGKFAVLDLMDIEDIWSAVEHKFEAVQKNLMPDLMSKVLIEEEKYLTLAKPSDGEEYSEKMFMGGRVPNFKLVILTQLFSPPKEIADQCYIIRIHTQEQNF